jgi:hypothetical protein
MNYKIYEVDSYGKIKTRNQHKASFIKLYCYGKYTHFP